MLRIEDISKENLEDVFLICSGHRGFAPADGYLQEKGKKLKRQWLLNMLKQYGPCIKLAYLNEKPVAQILFYPEASILYLNNPRKDVIYIKCIYILSPDARGKGVGSALLKNLIDECHTGPKCLGGKPCRFLVTRVDWPSEGDLPISHFYEKYGFKQGHQEMFLEIKDKYVPREIPEFRSLPEDRGRVLLTYNIDCEWGLYAVTKIKELIQGKYPNLPFEIINNWERPEEYKKRPHLPLMAGSVIVNAQAIKNPFLFWFDQPAFLRCVDEALQK